MVAARRSELFRERFLAFDGAAGDDEMDVGTFHRDLRERVEQHVESLPGVDAADGADEQRVVGDADPRAERARPAGMELVRIRGLVDDDDVRRIELIRDGLRHRDHARRETPRQEALDAEGEAGLHVDLACVPDVRATGEQRCRPPVPGMQRVGVHDVDLLAPDEPHEPADRERPAEHVPQPVANPVAGRDPLHRDGVEGGAGGCILVGERRRAG